MNWVCRECGYEVEFTDNEQPSICPCCGAEAEAAQIDAARAALREMHEREQREIKEMAARLKAEKEREIREAKEAEAKRIEAELMALRRAKLRAAEAGRQALVRGLGAMIRALPLVVLILSLICSAWVAVSINKSGFSEHFAELKQQLALLAPFERLSGEVAQSKYLLNERFAVSEDAESNFFTALRENISAAAAAQTEVRQNLADNLELARDIAKRNADAALDYLAEKGWKQNE